MTRPKSVVDFIDADKIFEELDKLDKVQQVVLTTELIEICRDRLLVDLATVRRSAALSLRYDGWRPAEIARAIGTSIPVVSRLLTEARMHASPEVENVA